MMKTGILVCLAFLFTGCKSTSPDPAPTNCVFTGKEVTVTRMHDGKEVGFCCSKCTDKWDGMTDAEKADALMAR